MFSSRKIVPTFIYVGVLLVTLAPSMLAQQTLQQLCSSDWFAAQRSKWANDQHLEFRLIEDGQFTQEQSSYAVGIAFAEAAQPDAKGRPYFGDDVRLLAYRTEGENQNFRQIYSEKVDVLSVDFQDDPDKCVFKGRPPFLDLTVTDLAGDGKQEIVLETNGIGVCPSCLSVVRVYQVRGEAVTKLVEEPYNGISFGQEKGLAIHTFEYRENGLVVGIDKYFFGAKHDSLSTQSAPAESTITAPGATSRPRDVKPRTNSGSWYLAVLDKWGPAAAGVLLAALCLFAYFQSRSKRTNQ